MQPSYRLPDFERKSAVRGEQSPKKAIHWAKRQYRIARWHSAVSAVGHWFLGVDYHLPGLEIAHYGCAMSMWQYIGLRSVPLREIHGSERQSDQFDRAFRPLARASENQWLHALIDLFYYENFQPAEVIKIEDGYYVQNGLYRISAARWLGSTTYLAYVTEWEVEIEPAAAPHPSSVEGRTSPNGPRSKKKTNGSRILQFFGEKQRREVKAKVYIPHPADMLVNVKF